MNKKKYGFYFIFLILSLIPGCNTADLEIPELQRLALISGVIHPVNVTGKVYLKDVGFADSTEIDSTTGRFRFENIPFGHYLLIVKTNQFPEYSKKLYFNYTLEILNPITLKNLPQEIYSVSPNDSIMISKKNIKKDSVSFDFQFTKSMIEESIKKAMLLTPNVPFAIEFRGDKDCRILIAASELFKIPTLKIRLDTIAQSKAHVKLKKPFELIYFIDTSKFNEVIYEQMISYIRYPRSYNKNDSLKIKFNKDIKKESIQGKLSFSPPVKFQTDMHFDHYANLLYLYFEEPLHNGTTYSLSFDSGITTFDGLVYKEKVSTTFETEDFSIERTYPFNKNIASQEPIVIYANNETDTASFKTAFSINPNDVSYTFDFKENFIVIRHSPFTQGKEYDITINKSLTNFLGDTLGAGFSVRYAIVPDSLVTDKTLNIKTIPDDTTLHIKPGDTVRFFFPHALNKQKLKEKFTITPAVPVTLECRDTIFINSLVPMKGTFITFYPNTIFQSASFYSVSFDTLYYHDNITWLKKYHYSFRTSPTELISFYPNNGQVNVSTAKPFVFEFSTPIIKKTFLNYLEINPPVDSLGILNDDDSDSLVVNHAPIKKNQKYTITVSKDVLDIFGNKIDKGIVFDFYSEL